MRTLIAVTESQDLSPASSAMLLHFSWCITHAVQQQSWKDPDPIPTQPTPRGSCHQGTLDLFRHGKPRNVASHAGCQYSTQKGHSRRAVQPRQPCLGLLAIATFPAETELIRTYSCSALQVSLRAVPWPVLDRLDSPCISSQSAPSAERAHQSPHSTSSHSFPVNPVYP
ncbi:hypothetical protein N657DRAFT_90401 [Parathielavia appendiculata]|uniref:Uncharacterized protein n=1 Tax=Parathielavia appendiculata TaxID=2587402 RepID=A0AAN6UDM6_9PEZI|nr:hypothetical protein N657DRAFT_90401 [Parathielavia appendiculata]